MNSIAPPDLLQVHISESGEEEFEQLVSLLEDTPQSFALIIVRSDFDTSTRDALLEHLGHRLAPLPLHTVPLSRESFDVPLLLAEMQPRIEDAAVIAITGLEETPQIAAEPEDRAGRPPAIAILNHGREAIRRIGRPIIMWCDPVAYAALREHAPDFFDHYTGLFTFLDAAPVAEHIGLLRAEPSSVSSLLLGQSWTTIEQGSRVSSAVAVKFYEDQLATLEHHNPDRARALLGLVNSLLSRPQDRLILDPIKRAKVAAQEALEIFENVGDQVSVARVHVALARLAETDLELQGVSHAVFHPKVQSHIAQALEIFTEDQYPFEWAGLMFMQGTDALQAGQDEEALRKSLTMLQSAQRVFTRHEDPYFWASCEMSLGELYASLPYTKTNNKKAVVHYEAAARVFQQLNRFDMLAHNQLFLGRALLSAAEHIEDKNERAKLLRRSLECFVKVEGLFNQLNDAEHRALALTLQALVLDNLPTGNRKAHLRQSADAWLRAANLLANGMDAQAAVSFQQAGEALVQLATRTRMPTSLNEARRAFESACAIYEKVGDLERARQCADKVLDLEALLKKAA